ncbi:MAG: glycosyltransferase, partial [Candidatus Woesearchaeota archaeon]
MKSKVLQMQEHYHDGYFLVGPYFPDKVVGELQEKAAPDWLKKVFETLKKEGIVCHFGHWLVQGNPSTILIDFSGYSQNKNNIKSRLWDEYKIDSLGTEWFDYDQPVVWATAAGRLIELAGKGAKKCVAHFHEWLSGAGLLYLNSKKSGVATVFTTHATMLGRTLASSNVNLYNELETIEADKAAYTHKVAAKHFTEKACANTANVFTTVSEITGMEAEHFFKRKPDVLTLNGLDMSKFPTFEETTIKHRLYKNRLREFLMYYFFPHYTFDLDKTVFYFIVGRYEYRDKGIDVLIKSLGKLNERLKQERSQRTVACFFWIPAGIRGTRPELVENKTFFNDIRDSVEDSHDDIKNRLIYGLVSQHKITEKTLLDPEVLDDIQRKVLKLKKQGLPHLATHDLQDEANDPIVNGFKESNLLNKKEDRVKVIMYPIYLTGADGLLDISYYESMQACHLGIFPSYYEPWGYTPLESAALGVPAVTTDLAGFGRFISQEIKPMQPGIFLLHRFNKTDREVVSELT